jgi:hypothetical protein
LLGLTTLTTFAFAESEVSSENTLFQAQKGGKTGSLQKPTNLSENNLTGLSR